MANPVYSIAPNPHWVLIDNFNKLPDGAAIYTYRSLQPDTFKPAFQDAAGQIPYGQPILGFGNGTMPPIFWEFDPNNPQETYYIRVYDSDDPNTQEFLWDFDGISGNSGSGGGGTVVSAYDIENLVVNNVFYRNVGNQVSPLPTSITLAPGAHEGFVNDPNNVNVVNNGPVSPDIIFAKNNTTATDTISFINFTPLGIHALPGQAVTPQQYMRYACTGPGSGETYKYLQFPISQGVQSLSSQPCVVKIFGRCNSGDPTIVVRWRQFFGSGGAPSFDQFEVISTITLTNVWTVTTVNTVTPDASTLTIGSCGNDGLFLEIVYPFDIATSIDIVRPEVYLGSIAPGIQYDTNDQIDSLINTPRTGDIRMSLNSFIPGWVAMDDGTIGDATSGATRANIDTFALFTLLWNTFVGDQTLAPMFDNAGNPVVYGADPVDDFVNHRRLSLTKQAGRVIAGVSGGHLIGTNTGAETVTLTTGNLPNTDGVHALLGYLCNVGAGGSINFALAPGNNNFFVTPGGTPVNIMQPTVYQNIFMKL